MFRRERVIAVGRVLFLLAPWVFIAYLFRDVDAVLDAFQDASLAPMVGGLLLTLTSLVGAALLWTSLVGHLSRDVAVPDTPHLLRAFARSWLARYLPGKVWSYGARVVHTDAEVTPRRIVVSSLVYEFVLIMGTATVLGLGLWVGAVAVLAAAPILVTGMATVALVVSRLHDLAQLALRLLGRVLPQRWRSAGGELQAAKDDPGMGVRGSFVFSCGYMLINLVGGLAFVLVVASLGHVGGSDIALLVGAYNLAAVIGVMAVFAPAGLGVREAILVGFLTPVVSFPVAASAVVTLRALSIVGDILFFILAEVLSARSGAPSRAAASPNPSGDGAELPQVRR